MCVCAYVRAWVCVCKNSLPRVAAAATAPLSRALFPAHFALQPLSALIYHDFIFSRKLRRCSPDLSSLFFDFPEKQPLSFISFLALLLQYK